MATGTRGGSGDCQGRRRGRRLVIKHTPGLCSMVESPPRTSPKWERRVPTPLPRLPRLVRPEVARQQPTKQKRFQTHVWEWLCTAPSDGNKPQLDRESGGQTSGSRHQRAGAGPETTRNAKGGVARAKGVQAEPEFPTGMPFRIRIQCLNKGHLPSRRW